MKLPIKSLASQRPRDNAEVQVYELLHVYHGFCNRLYVLA